MLIIFTNIYIYSERKVNIITEVLLLLEGLCSLAS